MSHISVDDFNRLIREQSPFGVWLGLTLESVTPGQARLRLPYRPELLRPGGTVHGPVLMAAADYAMYAVAMSIWERGGTAVSANINISFLRRTSDRDLVCEARVLRSGRRLAFLEANVFSDGSTEPTAHVTASYALPQE
ncbi:MAG: PaaI family thioesterase [Alphaproteobacteria bacterium]|nr:PaaI family thioesterase [Alphaproteobacteria bacterium]